MKKPAAVLFSILLGATLLVALGRVFVSSVGGTRAPEPAGIILSPPKDAVVRRAGPLTAEDGARALAALAADNPGRPRIAVDTIREGTHVLLVLDREAGTIEEARSGAAGTRITRVFPGAVAERLAHARSTGRFDAPGLPPPVEKNLYH